MDNTLGVYVEAFYFTKYNYGSTAGFCLEATTFTYRSYKHFNKTTFLHDLSAIPYHITEIFDDVDDAYYVCMECVNNASSE